jgi:hypothetical protein
MFQNLCEFFTGILTHLDPVCCPEKQAIKDFGNAMSDIPNDLVMPVHTAEVMRQIRNSQLKEHDWVGGDAWFGSVHTTVSTMKYFGVHLLWIAKNNSSFSQRDHSGR